MGKRVKVDETDMEIIESVVTGKGLIPIKSIGEFKEMARMGKNTYDSFMEQIQDMTLKQARTIKNLRIVKNYSWRALAHEIHNKGWFGEFVPPSNQIAGMALCEVAGDLLDEKID